MRVLASQKRRWQERRATYSTSEFEPEDAAQRRYPQAGGNYAARHVRFTSASLHWGEKNDPRPNEGKDGGVSEAVTRLTAVEPRSTALEKDIRFIYRELGWLRRGMTSLLNRFGIDPPEDDEE